MKGKRYFKCDANKGMFILAKEIQRKLSPEELIQKIIHLSEALSRARQQRQNNMRSMMTYSEARAKQEQVLESLYKSERVHFKSFSTIPDPAHIKAHAKQC